MNHCEGGRIRNTFKLLAGMKNHHLGIVLGIIFGVLQHLATIAATALGAYMVGLAANGTLLERNVPYLKILFLLIVLRAIFTYLESFINHNISYQILAEFRIKLYDAVERVSPKILLDMRSGQLASTLMSDVEVLEWFYAHTFGSILVAVIVPVIVLAFMRTIHPLIAILMLFFLLITVSIPFFLYKKADAQGKVVRENLADANAVTVEGIQGMKEILMNDYRDRYREKNTRYMNRLYVSQIEYGRRLGLEGALIEISTGFAMIGIAVLSISLIFGGGVASEWYSAIVLLAVMIYNPVLLISSMARNFGLITAAADRVFRVMEAIPDVKDTGKMENTEDLEKKVSFEHVQFCYGEGRKNALEDISFTINPGEMVALVGHSGAGKSTCVNLLLRYWDVTGGAVKIGGIDVREFKLESLREMISVVLQDVYLFNISIRENIRLGRLDATDEEVEEAAKLALADNFIKSLPEGYDTFVGERGAQLSGGQRQRIAIARAILKNSPILILDEAVSALDTENEREVQQSFAHIYKDRATLVVAHRLSTIVDADKILVMDQGRVVQCGTHEELMAQGGLYEELIRYQYDDVRANQSV